MQGADGEDCGAAGGDGLAVTGLGGGSLPMPAWFRTPVLCSFGIVS
jgi:hypothetical protein